MNIDLINLAHGYASFLRGNIMDLPIVATTSEEMAATFEALAKRVGEAEARAEKAEAELAKHKWQPIETAPKIELAEVVLWNGKTVCAGSWWEGSWSTLHDYIDPQPTHWMPLPEPPKEAEE